jgi:hypothetical protein
MTAPPALQIHAGPRARARLREQGLRAEDVRAVPAAAGGPKGLALLPLDRYLFGHWLPTSTQTVHLLGASIGAWRMACAACPDADAALAQLAEDYVMQEYPREPGRMPTARAVSREFSRVLSLRLQPQARAILSHPRFRLHVFTSRGRRLLHRPGPLAMPVGWLGAFVSNAVSRRALGLSVERVVFGDPREPLPLPLSDYRPTHQVALTENNLHAAVLASCAIPFALEPVRDPQGGPPGSYWDGGITDYHLHLNYAALGDGLVLYPHFGPQVVPGWLDKALKRRHRASAFLDNLVVLSPSPEWVASLPNGKLPDRKDFKAYGERIPERQRDWRRVVGESQRLADEFATLVDASAAGRPVQALPLK